MMFLFYFILVGRLVLAFFSQPMLSFFTKGLASYFKAETTFTFHFSILTLSNAFLSINNREMKSESGFSLAFVYIGGCTATEVFLLFIAAPGTLQAILSSLQCFFLIID